MATIFYFTWMLSKLWSSRKSQSETFVCVCDYKLDARRQDMVGLNDSFLKKKFIAAVKHEGGGV